MPQGSAEREREGRYLALESIYHETIFEFNSVSYLMHFECVLFKSEHYLIQQMIRLKNLDTAMAIFWWNSQYKTIPYNMNNIYHHHSDSIFKAIYSRNDMSPVLIPLAVNLISVVILWISSFPELPQFLYNTWYQNTEATHYVAAVQSLNFVRPLPSMRHASHRWRHWESDV